VERSDLSPDTIATEVFLFPAAGPAEKSGTFTNTQRMLQYRNQAVEPPGDARSEMWFMYHLGRRLKERARNDPRPRNAGLNALTWDYPVQGERAEPDVEKVLQEINGHTVADGKLLPGFKALKNDGSTDCGCWIYSGVFPNLGENRANQREGKGYLGHGWGFAWPRDCRILYNRASARPDGRPWSERKKLVWWDEEKRRWTGLDTPDFEPSTPPDAAENLANGHGVEALGGARPFVLHPDGLAWLFVPSGLKDGPLPAHYEPLESLFSNAMYGQGTDPAAQKKERAENPYGISRGSTLSLYSYHLSFDGTPHCGRHDANTVSSGGVAARTVCRDLAGVGGRCRTRAWRLGDNQYSAGQSRSACAGDAAHASAVG